MSLRASSRKFVSPSRDGDSTTSLGHILLKGRKDTKIQYPREASFPCKSWKALDQPSNGFVAFTSPRTQSYKIIIITALSRYFYVILALRIHCWNSKIPAIELCKALIFKSSRDTKQVRIMRLFWRHVLTLRSGAFCYQAFWYHWLFLIGKSTFQALKL